MLHLTSSTNMSRFRNTKAVHIGLKKRPHVEQRFAEVFPLLLNPFAQGSKKSEIKGEVEPVKVSQVPIARALTRFADVATFTVILLPSWI